LVKMRARHAIAAADARYAAAPRDKAIKAGDRCQSHALEKSENFWKGPWVTKWFSVSGRTLRRVTPAHSDCT
jgi:hypothetical protein